MSPRWWKSRTWPEPAQGDDRSLHVDKLILPEITIGEGDPDLYHTLGQFTMEYTGNIRVGKPVMKDGAPLASVSFDGSFTVHDTYDWGDSHGKTINIMGFEIPDSYGNLVEKQGLATPFQVGGTLNAKVMGTDREREAQRR